MEAQGYEVQPYVLPACAVNAPHRRDRVWFVAHAKLRSAGQDGNSDKAPGRGDTSIHPQGQSGDGKAIFDSGLCGLQGATPDADFPGRKERVQTERWEHTAENTTGLDNRVEQFGNDRGASNAGQYGNTISDWQNFPTQSPVCSRDDGFSSQLDGITFPKWRNESIKAAGNAIVPQVAYEIFRAIRAIELYEIQNGAK